MQGRAKAQGITTSTQPIPEPLIAPVRSAYPLITSDDDAINHVNARLISAIYNTSVDSPKRRRLAEHKTSGARPDVKLVGTDDETGYFTETLVKLVLTEVNTSVTFRSLRVLQLHCDEHNNYNFGPFKSDFQSQKVQISSLCFMGVKKCNTVFQEKRISL